MLDAIYFLEVLPIWKKNDSIHMWDLFWPSDFVSLLANNTKLYVEEKWDKLGERDRDWTPVTIGDIYI